MDLLKKTTTSHQNDYKLRQNNGCENFHIFFNGKKYIYEIVIMCIPPKKALALCPTSLETQKSQREGTGLEKSEIGWSPPPLPSSTIICKKIFKKRCFLSLLLGV